MIASRISEVIFLSSTVAEKPGVRRKRGTMYALDSNCTAQRNPPCISRTHCTTYSPDSIPLVIARKKRSNTTVDCSFVFLVLLVACPSLCSQSLLGRLADTFFRLQQQLAHRGFGSTGIVVGFGRTVRTVSTYSR